ncbi:MAG TPA: hypothetical protein VNP73_04470 [Actinomycetota bacterium]|nr:hypothetical protein [Actinomycetota bacterium]
MSRRLFTHIVVVFLVSVVGSMALVSPAVGETAEPTVSARAWYWEESQTQEITLPTGEKVTAETPNPFCPAIPGSLGAPEQGCAEGRLPIEIQRGDYETPNKVSAVAFDMSLVPVGSKVSKFTVTFLEAKPGCYDNADADENPNWCEQTEPINIDGKELLACRITDFLGDGDARPYKEVPKYKCANSDPTAKRKEVQTKDGETEHVWTFDLTSFASDWVKTFTTNTSIMLLPKPPQGYKPGDTDDADNWRVVLVGPKAPEGKVGVQTEIVFEPGELEPPVPPTTTDPGTTTTTGGSGTITGGTGTVTGGTDFGSTGTTGDLGGGGATAPTDTGGQTPPVAVAGAEQQAPGPPMYVWLAIVAGLIGWGLFRSVVLESSKGIRPNGVLSQIHALNTTRRGGEVEAAAAGPSAFSSFLSGVKNSASSLVGKLTKKG